MARKKIDEGSIEEQKKSSLSGRILQIRQTLFDDNNREFSNKIKVNEQALSQICSGKRNAGLEIVLKIVASIPEINANWLLSGEGSMLRSSDDPENPNPALLYMGEAAQEERKKEELKEEIAHLRRTIAQIQDYNDLLKEKISKLEEKEKENAFTSAETDKEPTLQ